MILYIHGQGFMTREQGVRVKALPYATSAANNVLNGQILTNPFGPCGDHVDQGGKESLNESPARSVHHQK